MDAGATPTALVILAGQAPPKAFVILVGQALPTALLILVGQALPKALARARRPLPPNNQKHKKPQPRAFAQQQNSTFLTKISLDFGKQ